MKHTVLYLRLYLDPKVWSLSLKFGLEGQANPNPNPIDLTYHGHGHGPWAWANLDPREGREEGREEVAMMCHLHTHYTLTHAQYLQDPVIRYGCGICDL